MRYFMNIQLSLFVAAVHSSLHTGDIKECRSPNRFLEILDDIYKERPFQTILIISKETIPQEAPVTDVYQHEVPKIIMENGTSFEFKLHYNMEVITVIIMHDIWNGDLLATAAETLNYMRQSRIIVMAWNIKEDILEDVKEKLLNTAGIYKMTRVLLILYQQNTEEMLLYLKLHPYPKYHWLYKNIAEPYFPELWQNLQNKTLKTFAEQTVPRIFLFKDDQGNLKLNGNVARLILLFAELFNATLELYQDPVMDKSSYYTNIDSLLASNLVDIPMSVVTGTRSGWLNNSAVTELTEVKLMVPCPRPLSMKEMYHIILNPYFLATIIMFSLIFSCIHSLCDYLLGGLKQPLDFVFSDKALPAILGQSFSARDSRSRALKLLYIMMFLTGLNISILFAANMKVLLTAPPRQKPIASFDDLNRSRLKVLAIEPVLEFLPGLIKNLVYTKNNTFYQEMRENFNTSYGYYLSSASWEMCKRKQSRLTAKIFCIYDNLTIYFALPMAIRLPQNSEYKESLDYLIHRVHDLGLMDAWHTSTFSDMLKTKEITLRVPSISSDDKVISAEDLLWVWVIVAIGLTLASFVFCVELFLGIFKIKTHNNSKKNCKK